MDVITGGKFLLGVGLGYRPGGVRHLRRADGRARRAASREARRDHPPAVDRGPRHAPGAPLAVQRCHASRRARCSRRAPPIIIGAQVRGGDHAGGEDRRRLAGGADPDARPARQADGDLHLGARPPPSCRRARTSAGCSRSAARPTTETAFRRVAPHLIEKYKAYFSWGLEGLTLDPKATPEQQFRSLAVNRFAVGSPAQVIDMLLAQHRAGITHLSHARELARHAPGRHPRRHRAARDARCCPRCGDGRLREHRARPLSPLFSRGEG